MTGVTALSFEALMACVHDSFGPCSRVILRHRSCVPHCQHHRRSVALPAGFPLYFMPEILSGAVFPLIADGYAASAADISAFGTVAALLFIWYSAETVSAKVSGWHLGPLYPLLALLRDLLLPLLWIDAWVGTEFVWRGHQMSIAADAPAS